MDIILKGDKDKKDASGWEKVLLARNSKRFRSSDMIQILFDSFLELHGDRCHGDDKSVVSGIALFDDIPVTVISQQKGKDMYDMEYRCYGMSMPEGYRKSLRLMKQAEKYNRPVICFIDTPGAFPGVLAEERGQALAIASNLYEMFKLHVPIISIILGEGGSGGALALEIANKVIMLENSVFSVVSPEGCASILWKDTKMVSKAANYLKLTAEDLYSYGIVDYLVSEENSVVDIGGRIREILHTILKEYMEYTSEQLISDRRLKYRSFDKLYLEK